MDCKRSEKIRRYHQGNEVSMMDEVIVEHQLKMIINGKKFMSLLCTPKSLEVLVVGFLFTEGVIKGYEEIKSLKLNEDRHICEVQLKGKDTALWQDDFLSGEKTVTSSSGRGRTKASPLEMVHIEKVRPLSLNLDKVIERCGEFNQASTLFQSTGGVHSCALCTEDEVLILEEDIGRHNAMDKIIGRTLMTGMDLSDKIILTSGRISSEIMNKIIRSGIPVIVSRSAPTDQAIRMAKQAGCQLIGFARGNRMNIYTE